jgi:hypothetical protein
MAEIAGSEKRQGLHLACSGKTAIDSKENSPAQLPKMAVKCESQAKFIRQSLIAGRRDLREKVPYSINSEVEPPPG